MKVIRGSKISYPRTFENQFALLMREWDRTIKKALNKNFVADISKLYGNRDAFFAFDDEIDDVERAIRRAEKEIDKQEKKFTNRIKKLTKRLIAFIFGGIIDSFKKDKYEQIGISENFLVDILANRKGLNRFVKIWSIKNANLIKGFSDELKSGVAQVVRNGFTNGNTLRVISQNIRKEYDISRKKADFWARDQVAKLNSDVSLNELDSLGINMFEWITANDDRVRSSHQALHRKICSIDDPTVYKDDIRGDWKQKSSIGGVELQPGQDYNCRCDMIPIGIVNN